jgi:hypothetical protein
MAHGGYAVLIADVVGSRARRNLRALLGQRLEMASRAHVRGKYVRLPCAITAGDEFQTIVGSFARLPELIFDLRERMWPLRLRVGIGIGKVPGRLRGPVNRLGGEAFQHARTALEGVKRGEGNKFKVLTRFKTKDAAFDATAKAMRLDMSTVSRNLKRGYFWQVEQTMKGMKLLMDERWSAGD